MHKVGILTILDLDNYGNRLQAYAVSKVIEDLNCKACQVRYCGNNFNLFLKEFIKANRILLNLYYFMQGILKGSRLTETIKNAGVLIYLHYFRKELRGRLCFVIGILIIIFVAVTRFGIHFTTSQVILPRLQLKRNVFHMQQALELVLCLSSMLVSIKII